MSDKKNFPETESQKKAKKYAFYFFFIPLFFPLALLLFRKGHSTLARIIGGSFFALMNWFDQQS